MSLLSLQSLVSSVLCDAWAESWKATSRPSRAQTRLSSSWDSTCSFNKDSLDIIMIWFLISLEFSWVQSQRMEKEQGRCDIQPVFTNTAIKIWLFEWITQSNDSSLLELLVSPRGRYFTAAHQPWAALNIRNTASRLHLNSAVKAF